MQELIFPHLHLFSMKKQWLKLDLLIKILILTLLVISLASPIYIDKFDPQNRKGIDIVLALDGSGSMNSSGFEKNSRKSRFEIAQSRAQSFIMDRDRDNIGVVIFGDYAFIASPITYEKEIVSEMIGYLNSGMAGQNTAIADGIMMSLRAFKHSKASSKVVILLSDGEHNSGDFSPQEAVQRAKEEGAKIYTIAITSEADNTLLKKIADETGGEFFLAKDSEELQSTYEKIDSLERSSIKSREYLSKEYYYAYPLMLAFAFLLIFLNRELR
ncbi:MAG: VWA domain-containing protein [Helicobacteraceae bacterium]|nr:VWA domain-containing protein [Helicobacteraceae bacterium]